MELERKKREEEERRRKHLEEEARMWVWKYFNICLFNCLDFVLTANSHQLWARSNLRRVHESFRYPLNNVQSSLINCHVTHGCFPLTRPDRSERSNCWMENVWASDLSDQKI
jgi:hypothetical protein